MKIATTKTENGDWRVTVDGKPTCLVICKADAPKWGRPQEWSIYAVENGAVSAVAGGLFGKNEAVQAIRKIVVSIMEPTEG